MVILMKTAYSLGKHRACCEEIKNLCGGEEKYSGMYCNLKRGYHILQQESVLNALLLLHSNPEEPVT